MIYPKIPLAQTIIQLCKSKKIKHIVISPGSRSAPLTIGFTNHPYFKCYSIVDERCAAFFALGLAQQLQEPTALVCTSGSALLNYYPAVAEAFYSDIPLVVLSADRPKHLVGIGDGQTINQKDVFKGHIAYSANLKLDLNENQSTTEDELPIFKNLENKLETLLGLKQGIQEYNEIEINKAINIATLHRGPVHINMPFEEPLYETTNTLGVNVKVISSEDRVATPNKAIISKYADSWNQATKKMILVGVNTPNQIDKKWFDMLAKDKSVIVFTETTSNIHHDEFFPSIDQIIAPLLEEQKNQLQPDVLLTFGGLVVSKKIKTFLRKFKPKKHWHIDTKKANDTFFCLTKHFKTTPEVFFKSFLPLTKPYTSSSSYKNLWNSIKENRLKNHDLYLSKIPYSDFTVFNTVLKTIPNHTILQVSNSSAIRYTQLFELNKTLEVYCNRGTSGIDGSTSTAIGCAVANNNKQTLLLTGDLSFLYDSNALWNTYVPNTFRIIIVNNQGGGIFRILPGNKNTDNFNTYFETNHKLTAEHLCKMYDFEYIKASKEDELKAHLDTFFEISNKPKVLEIFTPKNLNDEILLNYFDFLK